MSQIKKPVIKTSNLPSKIPVTFLIAFSLLLDRCKAPAIAWGVFITLAVIAVITVIAVKAAEDPQDIFEPKSEKP